MGTTAAANGSTPRHWLARVGLTTPERRAWAMYDWAVSAMQTTVMVAVFPIFFVKVAGANTTPADATSSLATANAVALVIMTLLSPPMGAIADYFAVKKQMLVVFTLIGVAACAGMFFIERGDLTLAWWLFLFALVGGTGCMVPYEGLLPHLAPPEDVDRVSTAGYALGYVGGGVLLALNLAWIQKPEWFGLPHGEGLTPAQATLPARLAFLSVAAWWALFSIPILRRVKEPPRSREADEATTAYSWVDPFRRLLETFRELRSFRNLFLMLIAFMLYNDGIQTIIKMATAYGTEIGIPSGALIASILVVQFVGIPCTFLWGAIADRIGAKRSVFIGLLIYTVISIIGYYMKTATDFLILAGLVGLVQGGTQALSRSMFSSMVPPQKSGEFFGFFSVFEKFAGIFGPALFSLVIMLTGTSRGAIISVIAFFVAGAAVLARVNLADGVQAARAAEAGLRGR